MSTPVFYEIIAEASVPTCSLDDGFGFDFSEVRGYETNACTDLVKQRRNAYKTVIMEHESLPLVLRSIIVEYACLLTINNT
jgi:hypothetical protein